MKPGRELSLVTPQGKIAALTWGEQGSTRVLALHGWLDNAASFVPLAAHLEGLHLVAMDFPGHGHSDWRPGGLWYHYIDYAWDVLAAAQQLGWTEFHLLGHSLGAAVATAVAAALPERVLSLSLIEAIGPLSGHESGTAERLRSACVALGRLAEKPQPRYTSREQLGAARSADGRIDNDSAQLLVNRNLRPAEDAWQWRSDPRLRLPSPLRMTEAQVLDLLSSVQAPTLVVEAEPGSDLVKPAVAEARRNALQPMTILKLAGHHHLHMSSPEPVAAAIMEHLAAATEPS